MLETLLLGLIPVHLLYINNIKEISLSEYITTCAVISILLLSLYTPFYLFCDNISASILTLILWYFIYSFKKNILFFFTPYQSKRKHFRNSFVILYALTTLLTLTITYKLLKFTHPLIINRILLFAGIVLSFFIGFAIFGTFKKNSLASKKAINEMKERASLNLTSNNFSTTNCDFPDIYHIILDSHPGFNNMEFYDKNFEEQLLARNFKIFKNHYSNYDWTTYSVPSLLQMTYFKVGEDVKDIETNNMEVYWSNLSNNLFKYLLTKSYNLNLIYPSLTFNANFDISGKCKIFSHKSTLQTRLLNMIKFNCGLPFKTPFFFINSPEEILSNFNKISNFTKETTPSYNFAHILAPHPPCWFDAKGNKNTNGKDDVFEYVKFCNNKIITSIENIQKRNPDAIILVHSDHGISLNEYRYRILSTIYLPRKYSGIVIPEKLTLVNLFRYLLNGIFNEKFEILEDKFYHMDWPYSSRLAKIDSQFEDNGNPYYKT